MATLSPTGTYSASNNTGGSFSAPVAVPTFGSPVTNSAGKTVGVAAYNPNTGQPLAGAGPYNPNTGQLFSSSSPTTSAPTQTSTPAPATTTPVVTAQSAQDDFNQKLATFNSILNSVKTQSTNLSQAQAYAAEKKAADDVQAAQLKLQQQGMDNQTAETNAKNTALKLAGADTTTTSTASTPSTGATPTPAPGSTPAPALQDMSSTVGAAQSGLTTALNDKISGMNDIQTARDSITQQSNNALASLMSGTIPLSGPQQALITSLQNQLTQNVADQTQANNALTGAVTESAFRSGGEYTPEQMAGQIHTAVSTGVQKIQALDNSAASTIAQLEQSFQKDNFSIINQQFANLTKNLDDKAAAIQDTYNTVTKAIQDARDATVNAQKTQFDESLQSAQFDFTKSQGLIDDMFKKAQITETQRHDMQDELNQKAQIAISQANQKIAQSEFNVKYGVFTNPDGTVNTSITPQQIPGYTQLPNGTSVVDNSNSLYATSRIGGLPVLSTSALKTASDSAQAANTLNQLQVLYNTINAQNGNTAANRANYTALTDSLPANMQKMVPSVGAFYSGNIFGSTAGGNTQFSSALNYANSQISSVIPNYHAPQFGKTFTTMSDAGNYLKQTGNTAFYTNLKSQGYSDDQILQVINGN